MEITTRMTNIAKKRRARRKRRRRIPTSKYLNAGARFATARSGLNGRNAAATNAGGRITEGPCLKRPSPDTDVCTYQFLALAALILLLVSEIRSKG
jgi:hypothetical protein